MSTPRSYSFFRKSRRRGEERGQGIRGHALVAVVRLLLLRHALRDPLRDLANLEKEEGKLWRSLSSSPTLSADLAKGGERKGETGPHRSGSACVARWLGSQSFQRAYPFARLCVPTAPQTAHFFSLHESRYTRIWYEHVINCMGILDRDLLACIICYAWYQECLKGCMLG